MNDAMLTPPHNPTSSCPLTPSSNNTMTPSCPSTPTQSTPNSSCPNTPDEASNNIAPTKRGNIAKTVKFSKSSGKRYVFYVWRRLNDEQIEHLKASTCSLKDKDNNLTTP